MPIEIGPNLTEAIRYIALAIGVPAGIYFYCKYWRGGL